MTGPETALDAALEYAARGLLVFPASRKKPDITDWQQLATTDAEQITVWWTKWPFALIGMVTGERSNTVVLDIDRKKGVDGFRTLAGLLDCPILPAAPTVLTPSAGTHLHFARPEGGFGNTGGDKGRGIGVGLDWRGDGGLCILPSPGSGYRWGNLNYNNCALRLPPTELFPKPKQSNSFNRLRVRVPTVGSLAGLVRCVANAPELTRNNTAFWAACRAGEMVTAGLLDTDTAIAVIAEAAQRAGLDRKEAMNTAKSGVQTGSAVHA